MNLLQIYNLANDLHSGQLDRAGKPYIEHLIRVKLRVQGAGGDTVQQSAALLHDVVEDGHTTLIMLLAMGVSSDCVEIVRLLTKTKGQSYQEYLQQIKADSAAKLVKIADIQDNSSTERLALLYQEDRLRLQNKYENALKFLCSE